MAITLDFINGGYVAPNGLNISLDFSPVEITIERVTLGQIIREGYVVYRLTFTSPVDFQTIDHTDLGNAGFASIKLVNLAHISSNVVEAKFYVMTGGTIQLQINQGAVIGKQTGGFFNTVTAIIDDEIVNVPLETVIDARVIRIGVDKTIVRSN